MLSLILSDYVV